MNALLQLGVPFFAILMVFFGVQYSRAGSFVGGLPPVPPWAPGGVAGAYLTGVLLILAGLSTLVRIKPRWGAARLESSFCFAS